MKERVGTEIQSGLPHGIDDEVMYIWLWQGKLTGLIPGFSGSCSTYLWKAESLLKKTWQKSASPLVSLLQNDYFFTTAIETVLLLSDT